jgi:type VI secretion system secreted protein Hcp
MAVDSFLLIDGIPGESLDDKHKDWIEILSFSHGITQPASATKGSAGGATTSRSEHGDYVITKYVDKASVKLAEACSNGKHISKIKIEMCRAGGTQVPYLVVNMEEVIISNIHAAGSADAKDFPTESVSFNYSKIDWTYTQQKRKDGSGGGNVTGKYDVAAGKS